MISQTQTSPNLISTGQFAVYCT